MNAIKRFFRSIWLRLTFQPTFKWPRTNRATSIIRYALDIGFVGYVRVENATGKFLNILLANDEVLVIGADIIKNSWYGWASSGYIGTLTGVHRAYAYERPHIIEMYELHVMLDFIETIPSSSPRHRRATRHSL